MLARISREELEQLFRGHGYNPHFVEGTEPDEVHQLMAATLDTVASEIKAIQAEARHMGSTKRPRWPMIIFRTPKGWTGPEGSGWLADGRFLPFASGAIGRIGD